MILAPGYLTTITNASNETIGYAWCDASDPATSYWSLPPVADRPPDAGVTFVLNPSAANTTQASFIATVRQNWSSSSRYLTCTETVYTSHDDIPQQDRARFFPNAGSPGPSDRAGEVDTGTTGIYAVREGGASLNVGVTYRDSSNPAEYDEYWVLGSAYSSASSNGLSSGTINSAFNSWSAGMTCVLVSTVETGDEPTAV